MPYLKVRNSEDTAWITFAWSEGEDGDGGSVADLRNEPYVVAAASSILTAERILTAGPGVLVVDGGGGGSITVAVDTAHPFNWLVGHTFRAAIDMDDNKITDLATPTNDYDAATKKYVDDNAGGGDEIWPFFLA